MNNKFKLIPGGLSNKEINKKFQFHRAYITQSFNLGEARMLIINRNEESDLFKYYYYTINLHESYINLMTSNEDDSQWLKSFFNFMGTKRTRLSQKEAMYIIDMISNKYGNPAIKDDYFKDTLNQEFKYNLTNKEKEKLISKLYLEVRNNYACINLFLSSFFSKDEAGLKFHSIGNNIESLENINSSTSFIISSNKITKKSDLYKVTSIILSTNNEEAYLINSEIKISDYKISYFSIKKKKFLSAFEFNSQLKNNNNYISYLETTTNEITDEDMKFDNAIPLFQYFQGQAVNFIFYKDHLEVLCKNEYSYTNKYYGELVILPIGEIIIRSYYPNDGIQILNILNKTKISNKLMLLFNASYNFNIFDRFIESSFPDFFTFLEETDMQNPMDQ